MLDQTYSYHHIMIPGYLTAVMMHGIPIRRGTARMELKTTIVARTVQKLRGDVPPHPHLVSSRLSELLFAKFPEPSQVPTEIVLNFLTKLETRVLDEWLWNFVKFTIIYQDVNKMNLRLTVFGHFLDDLQDLNFHPTVSTQRFKTSCSDTQTERERRIMPISYLWRLNRCVYVIQRTPDNSKYCLIQSRFGRIQNTLDPCSNEREQHFYTIYGRFEESFHLSKFLIPEESRSWRIRENRSDGKSEIIQGGMKFEINYRSEKIRRENLVKFV